MTAPALLSLPAAILVNVNIMLGSGIFINSMPLAHTAGALGSLVYPIVGLLIFPLIMAFSHLLAHYPGNTFYELGATVHPILGFLSSWGYFIGKLASAGLSIHIFVTLMQKISPLLNSYPALLCDSVIITLFALLITFNVKTGRPMQYLFVMLKCVPITIALYAALRLFDSAMITPDTILWEGIAPCIPLGIFAFAGFEASCSLSKTIKNSQRNAPLAIIISYAIVLVVITLFQTGLFGIFGMHLGSFTHFAEPFDYALSYLYGAETNLTNFLTTSAYIGIASSALGAGYGILYSNVWNLHTLARYGHAPFAKTIQKQNSFFAPYVCIGIAATLVLAYLLLSNALVMHGYFPRSQQLIPLQQIAAFSSTIAYTISVLAFVNLSFFITQAHRFMAVLSLASCGILYYTSIANAQKFGMLAYLIFGGLLLFGLLFMFKQAATHTVENK